MTKPIAFIPEIEAVLTTDSIKTQPTTVVEKQVAGPTEYQRWGDNNDYPKSIYDRCRPNSIIPSAIEWKARAVRSGGVRYGVIDGYKPDGTEIFRPVTVDEIEEFLSLNDLDLYFEEAFSDLYWFSHIFPELILSNDRKKIAALVHQEATFCRFSRQDQKSGKIGSVFIDANWPSGKAETWRKLPVIDPYFDPVGQIRNSKSFSFIYPLSYTSPGRIYYQQPSWHSIIDGNWLDVANQIPELKKYVMKNQMSIKYVIHIPEEWWEWKYPGFNTGKYTDAKRKEVMKTERDRFQSSLTGVTNSGKVLMLTYKTDASRNEYTKWEIKPFSTTKQDGEYMEESQEASSHILYALGIDGTLIGNTPGKQMGAGSGSDKRVAWNIFIINNKPYQDKVLKPLDLITKYNGWKGPDDKKIVWRFNNYLIATLDSGSEAKPMQNGQN